MDWPRYVYTPVGLDLYDRRPNQPAPGDIVVKVQPFGCPKNGTMGHCFVAPPGKPKEYSLVLENSLVQEEDDE